MFILLINLLCQVFFVHAHFNIELDFGAVATDYEPTVDIADFNARAILQAFQAANASEFDKTVIIPAKTFYFSAVRLYDMQHILFQIDGNLTAHSNLSTWKYDENGDAFDQFYLERMSDITFSGNGVIDGQGYNWWWYA